MPTQCKPLSFAFQGCQGRRVAAAFDGGAITSNAGVLLLREIDRSVGSWTRWQVASPTTAIPVSRNTRSGRW